MTKSPMVESGKNRGGSFEISDEWLYQQMPRVDKALLEEELEEGIEEYQFSRRFERRMKKLIRQQRSSSSSRMLKGILKKAAVFFLVLLLGSSVVVMSVDAFRMKFVSVVETVFETFGLLELVAHTELDEFQDIRPSYLPEGYTETEIEKENDIIRTMYQDERKNYIILQQTKITNDVNAFDVEYHEKRAVTVNGEEAYLYLKDNSYVCILWHVGTTQYWIKADLLSEEELIKMASSIVENKNDLK